MSNNSIISIDRTQSGAATLGHSRLGGDGNEDALLEPHCCHFQGHSLRRVLYLCRGAVSVFYSSSRQGGWLWVEHSVHRDSSRFSVSFCVFFFCIFLCIYFFFFFSELWLLFCFFLWRGCSDSFLEGHKKGFHGLTATPVGHKERENKILRLSFLFRLQVIYDSPVRCGLKKRKKSMF